MKTAIISSDTSTSHLTGDGHPEQPKRVIAIIEKIIRINEIKLNFL